VAAEALETYGGRIRSNPLQHASLTLAADQFTAGSEELTAVAETLPTEWREQLAGSYLPRRLLAGRPPDIERWLDRLDLQTAPPIWADRDQREGQPTVYACRSFSCSPPRTSMDAALDWFEA
jgi:uncharacterized protein YyaL (SSP411 family)